MSKAMRFQKYLHTSLGLPYGDRRSRKRYAEKVWGADFEILWKLIKICGLLLRTKVYLFWDKNWENRVS